MRKRATNVTRNLRISRLCAADTNTIESIIIFRCLSNQALQEKLCGLLIGNRNRNRNINRKRFTTQAIKDGQRTVVCWFETETETYSQRKRLKMAKEQLKMAKEQYRNRNRCTTQAIKDGPKKSTEIETKTETDSQRKLLKHCKRNCVVCWNQTLQEKLCGLLIATESKRLKVAKEQSYRFDLQEFDDCYGKILTLHVHVYSRQLVFWLVVHNWSK